MSAREHPIPQGAARRIKYFALLFLAFAILPSAGLLHAADDARIPYKLIYQIQERQALMAATVTNLHAFLRMKSTLPEVKITNLTVYIDSKEGRLPVPLDTNGIFSVPMRDTLLAENPPIVVNQPKGTMELGWFFGLWEAGVPTNGIHYAALMRPLRDLEQIRAAMVPGIADAPIWGLRFMYAPDKEAYIVIHAKSGDRTFHTDKSNSVVIPWEKSLLEEDPVINFSSPPEKYDVANER